MVVVAETVVVVAEVDECIVVVGQASTAGIKMATVVPFPADAVVQWTKNGALNAQVCRQLAMAQPVEAVVRLNV